VIKRIALLTLVLIMCTCQAFATSTYTNYLTLDKPGYGDTSWNTAVNGNFDILDKFGRQHGTDGLHTYVTADTLTVNGKLTADGATVFSRDTVTIPHISKTITPDGTCIFLDINFSSITLDATPTIGNGESGQILIVTAQTDETYTVCNLRDKDTYSGSNLDLDQSRRCVSAGTQLILLFDGHNWQEVNYIAKSL
jgi:hypothetical protein